MEGTMAAVTCFAANFAPKNWALCNGQLMSIAQNQALFALIGSTYGGDGVTTFGLPDLRGRTAISTGQGIGLGNYNLGQRAGTETVTLTVSNIPSHNHNGAVTLNLNGSSQDGTVKRVANTFPGGLASGAYSTVPSKTDKKPDSMTQPRYDVTIGVAGGGQPTSTLSPYLAVNYIICLYGIFPSRN